MAAPDSSSVADSASGLNSYSRKQKSLGLLCSKFIHLYDRDGVNSIELDEAACSLGVEKRRIYDIVNVLESIGVLVRKAKNSYCWKGFDAIPKALDDLREGALMENFRGGVKNLCTYDSDQGARCDDVKLPTDQAVGNVEDKSKSSSRFKENSSSDASTKSRNENRREISLALLTQNFVKLLLSTDSDIVPLDEAARLLLGDTPNSGIMQNNSAAILRRLYDIANVLSSMNLIQKTHTNTRKPAFRWLGYGGRNYERCATETDLLLHSKQGAKRVFGTDITNTDFTKCRLLSLSDEEQQSIKVAVNQEIQNKDIQMIRQKAPIAYDYGPFCPSTLVEGSGAVTTKKPACKWEKIASNFQPRYHNHEIKELFEHYMKTWKSWYGQMPQEKKQLLKENECSSV